MLEESPINQWISLTPSCKDSAIWFLNRKRWPPPIDGLKAIVDLIESMSFSFGESGQVFSSTFHARRLVSTIKMHQMTPSLFESPILHWPLSEAMNNGAFMDASAAVSSHR